MRIAILAVNRAPHTGIQITRSFLSLQPVKRSAFFDVLVTRFSGTTEKEPKNHRRNIGQADELRRFAATELYDYPRGKVPVRSILGPEDTTVFLAGNRVGGQTPLSLPNTIEIGTLPGV